MKRTITLILSLIAFNSYAQVPNGGMEDWHSYTVDGTQLTAPDGWFGSDSGVFALNETIPLLMLTPEQQIFKSGNVHGGTASARLETKDIGSFIGLAGASLSNARISFSQSGLLYEGGTNVSGQIPYVNAWVKYISGGGNDSGSMVVTAIVTGSNGDSIVGSGSVNIGGTNNQYVQAVAVMQYTDVNAVPEKLQITFNSSGSTPEDGSILWVDDISLSSLKASNSTIADNVVKCYPNPSAGPISIFNTSKEPVTIKAFSMNGQEVAQKQFTGNNTLDLTAQPSGLYFFTVTNQAGQTVQHGKLTIAK